MWAPVQARVGRSAAAVQTRLGRSDIRSRRRFLLPTPPQRPSAGAAQGTPGNAAGGVTESFPAGAASSSGCFMFPFPLHGPNCTHGQREGLKAKCSGRGQFLSFHSFHQKINSQVLGGTVTAHGNDVAPSEITRKGARPLGAAAVVAAARWGSSYFPLPGSVKGRAAALAGLGALRTSHWDGGL